MRKSCRLIGGLATVLLALRAVPALAQEAGGAAPALVPPAQVAGGALPPQILLMHDIEPLSPSARLQSAPDPAAAGSEAASTFLLPDVSVLGLALGGLLCTLLRRRHGPGRAAAPGAAG